MTIEEMIFGVNKFSSDALVPLKRADEDILSKIMGDNDVGSLSKKYMDNLYVAMYSFFPTVFYYNYPYCKDFVIINGELMGPKSSLDEAIDFYKNYIDTCFKEEKYNRWLLSLPHGICLEFISKMIWESEEIDKNMIDGFLSIYVSEDGSFSNIDKKILEKVKDKIPEECRHIEKLKVDKDGFVTVYRGLGSKSNPEGYSWSINESVAYNFACFYGDSNSRILTGRIHTDDIIAYIDDKANEYEVLALYQDVKIINEEKQYDFEQLCNDYQESFYFDILNDNYKQYARMLYSEKQGCHAIKHILCVMLNACMISALLDVDEELYTDILTACLFHDIGRENDREDVRHGAKSVKIMKQYGRMFRITKDIERAVKYHCLGDAAFNKDLEKIIDKDDREKAKLIYDILCDADALDRVRFGNKNLDVGYLRINESRKLVLFANLCNKNID